MAITTVWEGSATIGTTEHDLPSNTTTLGAQTDDGVYQLTIDCANLTAADLYELRLYEKVRAADMQRRHASWTIRGGGADPNFVVPSLIWVHGATVTLIKLSGTDRAISWSFRKVA